MPAARLRLESLAERVVPAFLDPVTYNAGSGPSALLAADFNDDTFVDLVAANTGGSNVSILWGAADGTFSAAENFATGVNPGSLAVGDFDADGLLDLATANSYNLSVLLGVDTGGFAAPISISIPSSPRSVAVGDFNGDGKLDLGVTSSVYVTDYCGYYGCWGHYEGHANVLLGNGNGTFVRKTTTIGYGDYTGAIAADVNGDDRDDFIAIHQYYGTVSVQINDGDGDLGVATDFGVGGTPVSIAAGDLDGDGHVDLVTGNQSSDNVSVLMGDGQGAFGVLRTYVTGDGPEEALVADIDGDGALDVATVNSVSMDVSVLLGRGDGTLAFPVSTATASTPVALTVGDFDGDTFLDVATVPNSGPKVTVQMNDETWPKAAAPALRIGDATITEGNTGSRNATFNLYLSEPYAEPVVVHLQTSDGTAVAGADYSLTAADVTFAANQTSKSVTIPILGDRVPEEPETFTVTCSTADAFLEDGAANATIFDNEPTLFIGNATVMEGNAGTRFARFKVRLSFAYDEPVIVPFTTANNSASATSDYVPVASTVTFPAGRTTRTVSVEVVGDRVPEVDETFFVNLGAVANAAIAEGQGVGTIRDNEPRISINGVTKSEGNSGMKMFVFTVRLSMAYNQPVTVNFATADGTAKAGSDYAAKGGTLTFAPGQTSKTIAILVYATTTPEADEYFHVNLGSPSSNALVDAGQGVAWILNDD